MGATKTQITNLLEMRFDYQSARNVLNNWRKFAQIKIVGNKKTLGMLEGFYGVTDDVVEVKNGENHSSGQTTPSLIKIPSL